MSSSKYFARSFLAATPQTGWSIPFLLTRWPEYVYVCSAETVSSLESPTIFNENQSFEGRENVGFSRSGSHILQIHLLVLQFLRSPQHLVAIFLLLVFIFQSLFWGFQLQVSVFGFHFFRINRFLDGFGTDFGSILDSLSHVGSLRDPVAGSRAGWSPSPPLAGFSIYL